MKVFKIIPEILIGMIALVLIGGALAVLFKQKVLQMIAGAKKFIMSKRLCLTT